MNYLYDNPTLVIVYAVVLEAIILITWLIARNPKSRLALLVGPVIVGLVLLIDRAVLTDREDLEGIVRRVIDYVELEEANPIIDLLSDDFRLDNDMDKTAITGVLEAYFAGPLISRNFSVDLVVTEALPERGQVEFCVITTFDPKSRYAYASVLRSQWRFDFVCEEEAGYKITKMTNIGLEGERPSVDVFKEKF